MEGKGITESRRSFFSFSGSSCLSATCLAEPQMALKRPIKMGAENSACGFLDIHCHILPKLDEGPLTSKESLEMIEIAHADGIAGIVATPHIMAGLYNNTKDIINKAVTDLKRLADYVPIFTGAEIRIDRDLAARVASDELPLINDKPFILLELPTYVIPPLPQLELIVKGLKQSRITPIFAHPERNVPILKDLSIMEKLISCGALFQVTAASITDRDMQKKTLKMIRKGHVHVVASDAHNAVKRPPILSGAFEIVSRKLDRDIAEWLFIRNPARITNGEHVGGFIP